MCDLCPSELPASFPCMSSLHGTIMHNLHRMHGIMVSNQNDKAACNLGLEYIANSCVQLGLDHALIVQSSTGSMGKEVKARLHL